MKKYFMCETGNEVKFGDRIELDLTEDLENGNMVHRHLDCKFHPMLVELLEEEGIIEEEEDDTEDETTLEELERRVIELEGIVAELTK